MSIKVAYNITNNKCVHISEIQNTNASKYKCLSCDNELILKSGEIIKPHFAHKPHSYCILSPKKSNTTFINEGEIHKQAKFLLYNYLNKNGKLRILRRCNNCKKEKTIINIKIQ